MRFGGRGHDDAVAVVAIAGVGYSCLAKARGTVTDRNGKGKVS